MGWSHQLSKQPGGAAINSLRNQREETLVAPGVNTGGTRIVSVGTKIDSDGTLVAPRVTRVHSGTTRVAFGTNRVTGGSFVEIRNTGNPLRYVVSFWLPSQLPARRYGSSRGAGCSAEPARRISIKSDFSAPRNPKTRPSTPGIIIKGLYFCFRVFAYIRNISMINHHFLAPVPCPPASSRR